MRLQTHWKQSLQVCVPPEFRDGALTLPVLRPDQGGLLSSGTGGTDTLGMPSPEYYASVTDAQSEVRHALSDGEVAMPVPIRECCGPGHLPSARADRLIPIDPLGNWQELMREMTEGGFDLM